MLPQTAQTSSIATLTLLRCIPYPWTLTLTFNLDFVLALDLEFDLALRLVAYLERNIRSLTNTLIFTIDLDL